MENNDLFYKAWQEIGEENFRKHFRYVWDVPVLDFVDTIVVNLPRPCWAQCSYCIDKDLIGHSMQAEDFIHTCSQVFSMFPRIKRISITGGSLFEDEFNLLLSNIVSRYDGVEITWNTNGIIPYVWNYNVKPLSFINLHRQDVDDNANAQKFHTVHNVLTLEDAKYYFGDKLSIRTVVDDDFDFDRYHALGLPLYLNRLINGTVDTEAKFWHLFKMLENGDNGTHENRRRNGYAEFSYRGIPIRMGIGDYGVTHVPGRKAVFLNVVILHRSGKVCGSWYEDDKLLKDFGQC